MSGAVRCSSALCLFPLYFVVGHVYCSLLLCLILLSSLIYSLTGPGWRPHYRHQHWSYRNLWLQTGRRRSGICCTGKNYSYALHYIVLLFTVSHVTLYKLNYCWLCSFNGYFFCHFPWGFLDYLVFIVLIFCIFSPLFLPYPALREVTMLQKPSSVTSPMSSPTMWGRRLRKLRHLEASLKRL